ncbi:hypothetical protein [Croceitalea dokdonensis]|uniref:hypothetical protein n=1 Tax=Croceitalea dokdonensis TaxID=346188 RepID=UPI0012F8E6D4|nr:hypothetical protein [Croceitalea dokdonensis]
MRNLFLCCSLLLVFNSCKDGEEIARETPTEAVFVSFQDMPDEPKMNPEALEILASWPEFKALETSFQVLYQSSNNEDLALAVTNVLEKEKALATSPYPELYDVPQIKSRQRVLRTFLLKVSASLAQRTDVNQPLEQMFLANNAWLNQFNVLVNNQLDLNQILDAQ